MAAPNITDGTVNFDSHITKVSVTTDGKYPAEWTTSGQTVAFSNVDGGIGTFVVTLDGDYVLDEVTLYDESGESTIQEKTDNTVTVLWGNTTNIVLTLTSKSSGGVAL